MSKRLQSPNPAGAGSGLAASVEQLCAKFAHDIGLTIAHNHKAGHSLIAIDADFSILEVIQCGIGVSQFLLCSRADVASLTAAGEEELACLGVADLLEFSILTDDELFQAHCIGARDGVVLL